MKMLGSLKSASKFILNVNFNRNDWKECKFIKVKKVKEERVPLDEIIPPFKNKQIVKELRSKNSKLIEQPLLPPRLTLLRMGQWEEIAKARISCYEPGAKLKLILKKRQGPGTSEIEEKVALEALCLSQIFGGIGKMTKRGFGAVKISIPTEKCKYESITNLINKIFSGEDTSIEALRNFIDQSMKDARELLQVGNGSPPGLPDFPVISQNNFKLALRKLTLENNTKIDDYLKDMGYKDTKTMRLLAWLGYSAMKVAWKINANKSPEEPGFDFHTWILGLPRGVETGYKPADKYAKKYARRTSSISLRPLRRIGDNSWQVLVYGFLSKDWPRIEHGRRLVSVAIKDAFDQAWKVLDDILR